MTGSISETKRWGFGPAFFLVFLGAEAWAAEEPELFGQLQVQAISEPEPVKGMLGNWGDEFEGGKRQWLYGRAEFGVRYASGLDVSLFTRAQADVRLNEEAASFYGKVKRDDALTPGEKTAVRVSVQGFIGNGLRMGYRFERNDWQVGLGASLFRADYLLEGDLWGEMRATSQEDFSFQANIDYVYYRDLIFGREDASRPEGIGWNGDISFLWQPLERLRFELVADDLFARVRWTDVPATRTLEPVSLEQRIEDGKQAPAGLWGERTIDRYYQDIDPRYRIRMDWNADTWHGTVRGQYQFGYGYLGLGLGRRFDNDVNVTGLWWPEYEQFGIEASRGKWAGYVVVDQVKWEKMQALTLGVSYGY